jgi:hypothetical protein
MFCLWRQDSLVAINKLDKRYNKLDKLCFITQQPPLLLKKGGCIIMGKPSKE